MKRNKRRNNARKAWLLGSVCVFVLVLLAFMINMFTKLSKVENFAEAGSIDSVVDAWHGGGITIVPDQNPTGTPSTPAPSPTPTEKPLLKAEFPNAYSHSGEMLEEFSSKNRIAYGFRYPVYESPESTAAAKAFAESVIEEQLMAYASQKSLDGVLLLDYEDGRTESLLSVIFRGSLTVNGKTETFEKLWVYNERAKESVNADELFGDLTYPYIVTWLQEGVENPIVDKEKLPKGDRETFSLYRFVDDGILFYYEQDGEEKTVCVPYIQLHTYMSVMINGVKVSDLIRQDLDPDKPMIALTFDDGPLKYESRTQRVLDALAANGARATFFMLGDNVVRKASPELLKAIGESGNEIASHTYSHSEDTLKSFTVERLKKEIEDTREAIYESTGMYPTLIRPPYGAYNDTVKKYAYAPLVTWNVDSEDWRLKDCDKIVEHVLSQARDGRIILMHDIHEFSVEAATVLIPELIARGYQLVTIRELFYYRGVELINGEVYSGGYQ